MYKDRKNWADSFMAGAKRIFADYDYFSRILFQPVCEIICVERACTFPHFVWETLNNGESFKSQTMKKFMKAVILVGALLFVLAFEFPTYAITDEEISGDVIDSVSLDLDVLEAESYISEDAMSQYEKSKVDPNTTSLSRLPEVYKASISKLNQSEQDKIANIALLIEKFLEDGKEYDASRLIGSALGRERKNSLSYLGWYCTHVLQYLDVGLDETVKFLGGFVSGYGKTGVLILNDEGINTIKVFGRKRGTQWKIVPEGSVPTDKFERIYKGQAAMFIPFSVGEIFTIDVYGAANGTVKMWKIHPGGINVKSWQGGLWEREVTVRGDRVY